MTEEQPMRESFIAELLLSVIAAVTLLSCLLFIRGFSEFINVSVYAQLIPLILAGLHTFVRRKWTGLLPCFLMHAAVSLAFYFAVISIPAAEFGSCVSNKVYLAVIVTVFTMFSISYRLNPVLLASESQFIALPACVIPVCCAIYVIIGHTELVSMLGVHIMIIAVIYIVMRQIAVFDEKYYHSIRKSSRPVKFLKRQNYITAASLVVIFVISFTVLRLIPVSVLSDKISNLLRSLIPVIIRAFINLMIAILDLIDRLFRGVSTADELTGDLEIPEEELMNDEPWLRVVAGILAVLILIGLVVLVINSIRLLIQNAPRYRKEKAVTNSDAIVDTIEDIRPGKKAAVSRGHDFGKGHERRIRKQFYEKTKRAMKKGLPVSSSSTPGQIEKVLTENGDNEFPPLKKEYENIRYGN